MGSLDLGGPTGYSQRVTAPRPRWAVAAVVALLGIGLVLGYLLWWSRPTAFQPEASIFRAADRTVDPRHPITAMVAELPIGADDESLTIDRVRAQVRENSAEARITFHVCTFTDEGFLFTPGDSRSVCATSAPAEGRHLRLDRHTGIVMTLTPRHAGRVVITGTTITYSRGASHLWQHGTQDAAIELTVPVSG